MLRSLYFIHQRFSDVKAKQNHALQTPARIRVAADPGPMTNQLRLIEYWRKTTTRATHPNSQFPIEIYR